MLERRDLSRLTYEHLLSEASDSELLATAKEILGVLRPVETSGA